MVSTEYDRTKPIPEPTLRRLPGYHHYLRAVRDAGRESISCTHIGQELGLDPTQIRKDLAMTGIVGRPKVGYNIEELLDSIEGFLGWNNVTEAFLAGVGHLGQALMGYQQFNRYGLKLVAAFDVDEDKVGGTLHGKSILPMEKMTDLARRMHVQLGIITVPADQAQEVADRMVEGGIRAIWNFAPTSITTPPHVIVQDEDLFASLAVLSRRLRTAVTQ